MFSHIICLLFQLDIDLDETVDFILFSLEVIQSLLMGLLERFLFFRQFGNVFFKRCHFFREILHLGVNQHLI